MARILKTPIINSIAPFDPTKEYTVSFLYEDNQITKNRAVIYEVGTYEKIYDSEQTRMSLLHSIPANTLKDGGKYAIEIQIFDGNGNSSNFSEQRIFYCFTDPIFKIDNIDNVIKTSNISLSINYSQAKGENIKNFQFLLYDSTYILINSSPVFYSLTNDGHIFSSLDNTTTYYVKAIGETENGILLDTGYVKFITDYSVLPGNTVFTLENNYNDGYITIVSNIKDIKYLEKGCTIADGVLTIKNGYLEYNEGFEFNADMYLCISVKQIPLGTFVKTNDNVTISLIKICGLYYLELKVDDYILCKEVNVSLIDENQYSLVSNGKSAYVEIIRKNNIYDIRVKGD